LPLCQEDNIVYKPKIDFLATLLEGEALAVNLVETINRAAG